MVDLYRSFRRARRAILRRIDLVLLKVGYDRLLASFLKHRIKVERIGSLYGGWYLPYGEIDRDSVVYCVGCGEDISFDLGLIERYDCKIHGFDPTPRASRYVDSVAKSNRNYVFHRYGVWSSDGEMKFYEPALSEHVSHSLVNLQGTEDYIIVGVRSVPSVMEELGHDRIDLIKLDIEGAEYEVIESLIHAKIYPRILCVEFDEYVHPMDSGFKERIRASASQLFDAGYRVIHAEGNGNYTLMKVY